VFKFKHDTERKSQTFGQFIQKTNREVLENTQILPQKVKSLL